MTQMGRIEVTVQRRPVVVHHILGVRCRCGLNESQNISVWIADIKFCSIGHVTQGNQESNARSGKTLREHLCVLNADVDVDLFLALESCLVAWCGWRAFEMNVAAIAANSRVEALVNKLDGEAEPIAIERKRPRNIGDTENGRAMRKTF